MSVASTTRRQQFSLDGVEDEFTFTFRALTSAPENIKCVKTASGVDTNLTYITQFTVAVNSDGIGGTVTLVSPSAIGTGTLTVYRETTNLQSSDYDDYNQFPADTVETDFDIRTMVSQELSEALDRTLKLSISSTGVSTELPNPESGSVIGWDDAGTALENKTIVDATTLTLATQSQAEAGTNNTAYMSPLRTAQSISVLSPQLTKASTAEAQAGSNDTNYMTPSKTSIAITALGYSPTFANALSGSVIQVVNFTTGSPSSGTLTIPYDDSIPANSEGNEFMTCAITPKNASNILIIRTQANLAYSTGADGLTMALFKDSQTDALAATTQTYNGTIHVGTSQPSFIEHYMTAGTTSQITFKVRAGGHGAGTCQFNGLSGSRKFGGVMNSFITIIEVKA